MRGIVLDMDSSVSPTRGEQEMSVWNGHDACACYRPLFVFNQFGDLERCALRPASRQRAQCRWLGWCAQAGRCALPGQGLTHLFPGGRGPLHYPRFFLEAEQIKIMRSGYRPTKSSSIGSATCSSAQSDDHRTRCVGSMPISPISRKLDKAAPGDRQSRMASRRALSARRFHRHQLVAPGRPRRRLLQ